MNSAEYILRGSNFYHFLPDLGLSCDFFFMGVFLTGPRLTCAACCGFYVYSLNVSGASLCPSGFLTRTPALIWTGGSVLEGPRFSDAIVLITPADRRALASPVCNFRLI